MTLVGAGLRLVVLHDSLFADELSTDWIISGHGLAGVISTVHTDAEITPPLYFVLAWLATRIDLTPELLRSPSFVAGVVAIPMVYWLGLRTVGRQAATLASGITALSAFMIFYSTEARGYELMVVLVLASTLALLAGVDDGRARWWVAYAAGSCAAVYTHYTAVFALGAQLLWVLWAHPEARRAALLANLGAIVAFLPWFSGLIADLNSPTTNILGALEPFSIHTVRTSLERWSVGYPGAVGLGSVPGSVGLILIGSGVGLAIVGVGVCVRRRPRSGFVRIDRRLILIAVLALAAPVGEAAASLVGTDIFAARNLAVSWPAFALLLATLVSAGRRPFRLAAAVLLIAGLGIGAVRMLEPKHQRPDYRAAAEFIDNNSSPRDVVIDASVLSPGPFTGLDVALDPPRQVFRAGAPQEREHPFGVLDPILPPGTVVRGAVAAAHGGRVFLVSLHTDLAGAAAAHIAEQPAQVSRGPAYSQAARTLIEKPAQGYRLVETRIYPGIVPIEVRMYEKPRSRGT
jgi:hypothetical protein